VTEYRSVSSLLRRQDIVLRGAFGHRAHQPAAIRQGGQRARMRAKEEETSGNVHRVWTTLFSVEGAFLQLTLPDL
jgi:hypothetical protein